MLNPPASFNELVRQGERDEELREVAKPLESTHVRPRSSASSRGRPEIPRSGARSISRSNSAVPMREVCWNRGPDCPPQAESRCPGKAHKQGGP
eukprot:3737770-Pyramimonas_sp.AAC.1